jgi:hypothetical protein
VSYLPWQTLDLCCNQIMRPGALAVARALASRAKAAGGSKLQLLALDENAISEAGVEQLKSLLTVRGRDMSNCLMIRYCTVRLGMYGVKHICCMEGTQKHAWMT